MHAEAFLLVKYNFTNRILNNECFKNDVIILNI